MNWFMSAEKYVQLFTTLWPVLIQAVAKIEQDGKDFVKAIEDAKNHLTPGAPNSPSLNG